MGNGARILPDGVKVCPIAVSAWIAYIAAKFRNSSARIDHADRERLMRKIEVEIKNNEMDAERRLCPKWLYRGFPDIRSKYNVKQEGPISRKMDHLANIISMARKE